MLRQNNNTIHKNSYIQFNDRKMKRCVRSNSKYPDIWKLQKLNETYWKSSFRDGPSSTHDCTHLVHWPGPRWGPDSGARAHIGSFSTKTEKQLSETKWQPYFWGRIYFAWQNKDTFLSAGHLLDRTCAVISTGFIKNDMLWVAIHLMKLCVDSACLDADLSKECLIKIQNLDIQIYLYFYLGKKTKQNQETNIPSIHVWEPPIVPSAVGT